MDAIDGKILFHLQRDGRMSNAALAEAVHLSPSPCLRRVKRLEEDGVISGYRAVLDRAAVDLGLTVFIEVKASNQHRETVSADLQETFRAMDEVVACHIVSGMADFLLEVVVTDLRHYEELLMGRLLPMEGVADVQSYFVIRTVKADGPLPLGRTNRGR
jgi:Lrp/AsnC family transcriptional regulator, leucine-responsive regulatory protein